MTAKTASTQTAAFERQTLSATQAVSRAIRKAYDGLDERPPFFTFRSAVIAEHTRRIEDETPF